MSVEQKVLPEKHGVVFALLHEGKIQLKKRMKKGEFEGKIIIPGGGANADETLEEALLREIKEEYGVDGRVYKKLGTYPNIENNGTLNIRHLYLVTEWEGELSDPEKVNIHLEIPLDEAFDVCQHPLTQIFLQRIKDELSRQN